MTVVTVKWTIGVSARDARMDYDLVTRSDKPCSPLKWRNVLMDLALAAGRQPDEVFASPLRPTKAEAEAIIATLEDKSHART